LSFVLTTTRRFFTRVFGRSHLVDVDVARVEEAIEPPRPNRPVADPQRDLIVARRGRPPEMRPPAPGRRRRRQRAVFDSDPRLVAVEPNLQRVGGPGAAPHDADDAIGQAIAD